MLIWMLIIIRAVWEHTAMTVRSLCARCAPLDITDLDAEMWGAPLRPTQHKQWHNLLRRGAVLPVLLTHTGHSLQTAGFQITALSVAIQGTKKSIVSAPRLLAQPWLSAMHTIPLQPPLVPGAVTQDTVHPQQAILRRGFSAAGSRRGLILSVARLCAPAALLATMQVPGGNPHVSHARRVCCLDGAECVLHLHCWQLCCKFGFIGLCPMQCRINSGASGASTCTACAARSYTGSSSATVCTQCPAGTASSTVGAISCPSCVGNTYTVSTGNTVCSTCSLCTSNGQYRSGCCGANARTCDFSHN